MVELVQAGYLHSKYFSQETTETISQLAAEYMHVHGRLRQAHVAAGIANDWVLSVLSVKTENLLNPHTHHTVLAGFAYQYFLENLPKERFAKTTEETQSYEISLYVAVHQALLKSDIDVVRTELLHLYQISADNTGNYVAWNERIYEIYLSPLTQKLKRTVSKNGAPFRVLKSLMEDEHELPSILHSEAQFRQYYRHQIKKDYSRTTLRLNNGIIKSIIFLLITKGIIGLGVEVPYDLMMYGSVDKLPLIVNLLFPPLYMASIRLGLSMPSKANADADAKYMIELLYGSGKPGLNINERTRSYSPLAKLLLTLLFFVPIVITILILQWLNFNILQMIIFFIFFSTASFLGFRLRSMIRELKMIGSNSSLITIAVDFFYLPFIVLGQWLSSKYAKVNLVGKFLDIMIEMPLKTVLRLIRQWMRFLNEKHEEIY